MSETAQREPVSDSGLRNVRAWASARPDMSGAQAIVDAMDELLSARQRIETLEDKVDDLEQAVQAARMDCEDAYRDGYADGYEDGAESASEDWP